MSNLRGFSNADNGNLEMGVSVGDRKYFLRKKSHVNLKKQRENWPGAHQMKCW